MPKRQLNEILKEQLRTDESTHNFEIREAAEVDLSVGSPQVAAK